MATHIWQRYYLQDCKLSHDFRAEKRKCGSREAFFSFFPFLLIHREKSRSLSSTFWHIREKQGFHFLMGKLGNSSGWLWPPMKFIGWVNLIILFHLAPSRSLWDKYFSCYEFLKIYLRKMQIEFFPFFMILCRINKGAYLWLFEHANIRKHVYEQTCSSVRVF